MDRTATLIVNWNTPNDLDRCLKSFREHEPDKDVHVFQNYHSDQNTDASLRICWNYDVPVIKWEHNIGHGAGINHLATRVRDDYEFFFLMNPDCMWVEPVVDRLVGFLQADPDRAMVGPKQMDSKGRITAGGILGTLEQPQHRMFHEADPQNVKARDIQQSTVVAGSALMISVDDFFRYGPMLEAKHYYSETWICYHTIAHGRTNWYWGEPWMIHEWHGSSAQGFSGTDGMFKTDQALFRQKCDSHNPPIPHD